MTPELAIALAIATALVGVFNVILSFMLYSVRESLRDANTKILALQAEHHAVELKLASKYHDKDELSALLDEKLRPMNELLNQAVRWIEAQSGGAPLPRARGSL